MPSKITQKQTQISFKRGVGGVDASVLNPPLANNVMYVDTCH